ncbi:rhamnulokinase family protein [Brachybacterium phenoliresistens]|uniref:rhamnulokinase n=1 Tax=Brachybacterium phenoliresistens TaxID=396014 RepID=UPI0031DF18F6
MSGADAAGPAAASAAAPASAEAAASSEAAPSAAADGAAADPSLAVAAVDLGATSGRVMLGLVRPGETARLELHEARRFPNVLAERDGHLSWDIDALWEQIREGLRAAGALARERGLEGISSIGIDSWAVDYALVGPDGARRGEVIAYRDSRTDGVADQVAQIVSRERQFALTGIAQQPFNTLYQLAADDRLGRLPEGSQLLMVPDLVAFLLTGQRRTEVTNASSTGMLEASSPAWATELLAAAAGGRDAADAAGAGGTAGADGPAGAAGSAGLDAGLLAPLVEPGERVGTVLPELATELGIGEVPVIAAASHDTASAVLAVPAAADGPVAYISSGTWSLIGLELSAPITTEAAREAGFTNERGVDGTFRFLKNVAGMWLVSESIRQWEEDGASVELDGLLAAAAAVPGGRFRIDPTDPQFLAPGRMADRVTAAAEVIGGEDEFPRSPAQLVRCILESLAETYRTELHTACRLARQPLPERLHVVGGGSRNALLNQLTADALGIEVVAGPMEATALGNVAVQARALGAIGSAPGAMREAVRASVDLEVFTPSA